jgi:hypothetical protein
MDIPFKHTAIDIRSFAMAELKKPFSQTTKKQMPQEWRRDKEKMPLLAHKAIDDALEQGMLFIRMLEENKKNKAP